MSNTLSQPGFRALLTWLAMSFALLALLSAPSAVLAGQPPRAERRPAQEIDRLFSEDMKQAHANLKWRGERLTEDTIYAVALTGLSWELAWSKDHLFSLGWGDSRKIPMPGKRKANYTTLVNEIQRLYDRRDYRKAVETATANFSLDEIGSDVNLKEPVGYSLLAAGQPEQAFPIFAAPFEPGRDLSNVSDANRRFREAALLAAERAGLKREAVAFAVSLLLEPGTDPPIVPTKQMQYLEKIGVDVDRLLLGILQTPEHLRGLPAYYYAAADLLAYRASPHLLPFLLHLANSDDAYLRSRALIGLGIVGYQARAGEPRGGVAGIVSVPLREYGVSAGERKLIDKEIREGIASDKYRIRTAATLALALVGSEDSVPQLQKLAKDHAYLLFTPEANGADRNRAKRIEFPVRTAAALALARFGVRADPGNGDFTGKDLDKARRGNQDVTNDHRNLRHDVLSQLYFTPLDPLTAAPVENVRH